MDLIKIALRAGADVAGVARVAGLREKGAVEPGLLASAQTVIAVASAHSWSALASANLQVKQ